MEHRGEVGHRRPNVANGSEEARFELAQQLWIRDAVDLEVHERLARAALETVVDVAQRLERTVVGAADLEERMDHEVNAGARGREGVRH